MVVTTIRVARLFNTGNYEHERIEVECVLDDGETAEVVLARARAFITCNSLKRKEQIEQANKVLAEVENGKTEYYSYATVESAKKLLAAHEAGANGCSNAVL